MPDEMMELAELMENYYKEFYRLYFRAKNSGAVPDGTTSVELGRAVLVIAAEQFCYTKEGKALLANLRHFI